MRITTYLLLLVLLLATACQDTKISNHDEAYDVSVMSFNFRYDTSADGVNQWDNRKEAVLSMMNEVQPTIMGIQEGLHSQVLYVKDQLPAYEYVGVGRDDGKTKGEYAAIFYKSQNFQVLATDHFWLSETPESPSLGWDANNIRICTWAKLKDIAADKIIFVFNTHYDHMGKIAQEQSSKLLQQKIQELVDKDATVFITGDFNVLIDNKSLDPISKNYAAANLSAKITDNKKSYNAWGKNGVSKNIDFIFYQNAEAMSYKTVVEDYGVPYISDHYPIISHFNYE